MRDSIEEQLADHILAGEISAEDVRAVEDFAEFLSVVRREGEKLLVPGPWMPYARGEGPAPRSETS